jgi:hypothetical protein
MLSSGENNDYIIFATTENLRLLCGRPLISMDGTFDTVPNLFQQLFTLHAFQDKKLVPLVYVLMSRKTTAMYEEVFIDIKLHCTQIGCTLNPTEILTDFESGLLSAVRQQFPNSRHRGCHFHFCQVWYIVTKK